MVNLFNMSMVLLLVGVLPIPQSWADSDHGKFHLTQSSIKWLSYDKTSFSKARTLKRPLFVLVYSETCHWCRKYETETLEADSVKNRLSRDYLPIAVDAAKQAALAKELGAFVVPTTLLLAPDGHLIVRFRGFVDVRDLNDILDANLYRWRKGEIPAEDFGSEKTCCPIEAPPEYH